MFTPPLGYTLRLFVGYRSSETGNSYWRSAEVQNVWRCKLHFLIYSHGVFRKLDPRGKNMAICLLMLWRHRMSGSTALLFLKLSVDRWEKYFDPIVRKWQKDGDKSIMGAACFVSSPDVVEVISSRKWQKDGDKSIIGAACFVSSPDVVKVISSWGWEGRNIYDRIHVFQDTDTWRALVNKVMTLWVPQNVGNLLIR